MARKAKKSARRGAAAACTPGRGAPGTGSMRVAGASSSPLVGIMMQDPDHLGNFMRASVASEESVAVLCQLMAVSRQWRESAKTVLADVPWRAPFQALTVAFVRDTMWLTISLKMARGKSSPYLRERCAAFPTTMKAYTVDAPAQDQALTVAGTILDQKMARNPKEYVAVLQGVMQAHPEEADIQTKAASVVSTLCLEYSCAVSVRVLIAPLVRMLLLHGPLVSAVHALVRMMEPWSDTCAGLKETQQAMVRAGVVGALLRELRRHPTKQLFMLHCLRFFQRLVLYEPRALAQEGVGEALFECMRRYPHHLVVQAGAVNTLQMLARWGNAGSIDFFGASHGMRLVFAAAALSPEHAGMELVDIVARRSPESMRSMMEIGLLPLLVSTITSKPPRVVISAAMRLLALVYSDAQLRDPVR